MQFPNKKQFPNEMYNLRLEVDTKHCHVADAEWEHMEKALPQLEKVVKHFPVCDLYVTIDHHPRNRDYHVKTALVLPGKTLVTGENDDDSKVNAFERCIRKLVRRVESMKDEMSGFPEIAKHEKGTEREVEPGVAPDAAQLDEAVNEGDYQAFRRATFTYEEPVRKRIGRWIERYPQMEAKIGHGIEIADIVEEVFLNAFDRYPHRPKDVRFSEWLEQLIDPSVKALLRHPDEELENIRMAQSMREEE